MPAIDWGGIYQDPVVTAPPDAWKDTAVNVLNAPVSPVAAPIYTAAQIANQAWADRPAPAAAPVPDWSAQAAATLSNPTTLSGLGVDLNGLIKTLDKAISATPAGNVTMPANPTGNVTLPGSGGAPTQNTVLFSPPKQAALYAAVNNATGLTGDAQAKAALKVFNYINQLAVQNGSIPDSLWTNPDNLIATAKYALKGFDSTGTSAGWGDVNTIAGDLASGKITQAQASQLAATNGVDIKGVLDRVSQLRGSTLRAATPVRNSAGDVAGWNVNALGSPATSSAIATVDPVTGLVTPTPTTVTEPNMRPFAYNADTVLFDDGDLGKLPDQLRGLVAPVMAALGYIPSNVYGTYGERQYAKKPGTPRMAVSPELLDSVTKDPAAKAWLSYFFYKKGLGANVVTYPGSNTSGTIVNA